MKNTDITNGSENEIKSITSNILYIAIFTFALMLGLYAYKFHGNSLGNIGDFGQTGDFFWRYVKSSFWVFISCCAFDCSQTKPKHS